MPNAAVQEISESGGEMSESFDLKNGMILATTEASGGLYNSEQLKAIADLAEADGIVIKASEEQRLCLIIAPDIFEKVQTSLAEVGVGLRHYSPQLQLTGCCNCGL